MHQSLPYPPAGMPGYNQSQNPFVAIPRKVRVLIYIFVFLYTVLIIAANVYNLVTIDASYGLLVFSNILYLLCVFYPLMFYRESYGYCHPLILSTLFIALNLVIRSTGSMMNGIGGHSALVNYGTFDLNLLYAYGNFLMSLSLIFKYLGFFLAPKIRIPNLQGIFQNKPSGQFYLVMFISIGSGLVAFYLFTQLSGGFMAHIHNMNQPTRLKEYVTDVEGIGQYFIFMRLIPMAALVWMATKADCLKNPIFWGVGVLAVVIPYLEGGRRSAPIYAAIVMGLVWVLKNQRVPYARVTIIGVLAFFFIGIGSLFRVSTWHGDGKLSWDFLTETSVSEVIELSSEELIARSGSGSSMYAIFAKVPSEQPLLMGKSYVSWFGLFIPRFIWNNKPVGIGRMAGQIFYGRMAGVPPGPVGEAYWNFHIPGVCGVFFIFGMFLSWLGRTYIKYATAPAAIVLYISTLYYFTPFQTSFRNWVLAIIPATIVLCLCGLIRFSRR